MFGLSFATIKWIAIGLFVLAVVSYIGFLRLEVDHYKTKAADIEAQFTLVIRTQAVKLAAVETQVKEQDKARQDQTIKAQQEIDKLVATNKDLIKYYEKELVTVVISDRARRVFNNTDSTSRPDEEDTTRTPNGKDAKTKSSLADLLIANEVNKKNYLECREDKDAWINLWHETERNLNGTTTARSD